MVPSVDAGAILHGQAWLDCGDELKPTEEGVSRILNWAAYNQVLVRRGSLIVWIDKDAVAAWVGASAGSIGGARSSTSCNNAAHVSKTL